MQVKGTLERISARGLYEENEAHCLYLKEYPEKYFVMDQALELVQIGNYLEIILEGEPLRPRRDLEVEGKIGGYIVSLKAYTSKQGKMAGQEPFFDFKCD